MDRARLDLVVARMDALGHDPGAWTLPAWRDLWRETGALVGDGAGSDPPVTLAGCVEEVDRWLGRPGHRLVAYGTLRPGEPNHRLLAGLGTWRPATVSGRLGDWNGYPILRPGPSVGTVPVMVLTSSDLPAVMDRLDEFEGPAYRRARIVADLDADLDTGGGRVVAWCYVDARAREPR